MKVRPYVKTFTYVGYYESNKNIDVQGDITAKNEKVARRKAREMGLTLRSMKEKIRKPSYSEMREEARKLQREAMERGRPIMTATQGEKMQTAKQEKLETWLERADEQLDTLSGLDRKTSQNELRKAIKDLAETSKVFENNMSWWKHSIDSDTLHKAERRSKQVSALHSKLELEYNHK